MIALIQKIKKTIYKYRDDYRSKNNLSVLGTDQKKLILDIKKRKLTYLSNHKLLSLARTSNELNKTQVKGIFIEAGCALGGSSILLSKVKSSERSLFIYDVFEMIPPPTKEDTRDVHQRYSSILEGKSTGIGGDKYYGYETNLFNIIQMNFTDFNIDCKKENVFFVKGLVQDTLDVRDSVALAHIDVDWYDPVKTCLERIYPKLVVGGSIILDDYHAWGGCRKATDEFLLTIPNKYELDDSLESLKLTKLK